MLNESRTCIICSMTHPISNPITTNIIYFYNYPIIYPITAFIIIRAVSQPI